MTDSSASAADRSIRTAGVGTLFWVVGCLAVNFIYGLSGWGRTCSTAGCNTALGTIADSLVYLGLPALGVASFFLSFWLTKRNVRSGTVWLAGMFVGIALIVLAVMLRSAAFPMG